MLMDGWGLWDTGGVDFSSVYAHGFARVAACTLPVAVADPATNARSLLVEAQACDDDGVAVALFPELCLSGYAIDDLTERHARGTALTWTVADPDTDLLLGVVNVFDLAPRGTGDTGELGYVLHPAARGRGVCRRAAALALRHAFVDVEDGGLGLLKVRAVAAEGNTASRAVLADLGFTHQGRERMAVRVEGGAMADAAIYDVTPTEVVKTSA